MWAYLFLWHTLFQFCILFVGAVTLFFSRSSTHARGKHIFLSHFFTFSMLEKWTKYGYILNPLRLEDVPAAKDSEGPDLLVGHHQIREHRGEGDNEPDSSGSLIRPPPPPPSLQQVRQFRSRERRPTADSRKWPVYPCVVLPRPWQVLPKQVASLQERLLEKCFNF